MQKIERIIYRYVKSLIFSALIACLFAGCKTVRYVPVPSVSVDSVYVDRWHKDSVYLRDSVYVNRWTDGDNDREYFEIRMTNSELTNDFTLEITDFADADDVDDSCELWNSEVETLRRKCGF